LNFECTVGRTRARVHVFIFQLFVEGVLCVLLFRFMSYVSISAIYGARYSAELFSAQSVLLLSLQIYVFGFLADSDFFPYLLYTSMCVCVCVDGRLVTRVLE
jgi:hypothetical protein